MNHFTLDPAHASMDLFEQHITNHIWREKYRSSNEDHPHDSMERVVKGVYLYDLEGDHARKALDAMVTGLWVPGGRIHAGAGTDKAVTLINCYVDRTIEDSMVGIADALKDAMLTQQQGGGIGMDFSTLRPSGANLTRTGAVASGPLPFMDMWDAMCATIMSAGSRRGAMMGTMADDHPDLIKFITAKQTPGKLTNFNVSVLVSDAFMDAVTQDEEWYLGFNAPRHDGNHVAVVDKDEGPWYVYESWKARELWDMIIKNTYEYSEPGVIFIDRINDQNNLNYLEEIHCTNPCGEQPLPPNGACNLGAVNLSRMVQDPFGSSSHFDFDTLQKVVQIGVRFLDNVIDVTQYPLEAQKAEEVSKRRIGLGITGLANAIAMMRLRYGSEDSLQFTDTIMQSIKVAAYSASTILAKERGSFPSYDAALWGIGSPVVESLPTHVQKHIVDHGIRNGVLLTIAPTGTTSMYMGNCSSGLEPVFLFTADRKVRQPDGSYETYTTEDYGYRLHKQVEPKTPPEGFNYMITHEDLCVDDHVRMQAVCQKHIDASVSKTINCPETISYEDFKLVYWDAYNRGCKGCTTYRPSDTRGSVLSKPEDHVLTKALIARPEALKGETYKAKWPNAEAAYYITINEFDGKPYEIFINSTSSKYSDWTTALSLMISSIMRKGEDVGFIPEELKKVKSHHDTAWIDGKMYGSLVALIGDIIGKHLDCGDSSMIEELPPEQVKNPLKGDICPQCDSPTLIAQEGCSTCMSCGYSNCG